MKNNRKNRALFKIRAKHGRIFINVKLPANFDKEKFIKEWRENSSKGGLYVLNSSDKVTFIKSETSQALKDYIEIKDQLIEKAHNHLGFK